MSRVPQRLTRISLRCALPAILASLDMNAFAAPVTTAKKPQASTPPPAAALAMPAGAAVSPAAAERLRKAGLDPKDPN
ncbi:MAG: hypothetical protein WCC53_00465, partial [Thermoanaerobaculia bacterium]